MARHDGGQILGQRTELGASGRVQFLAGDLGRQVRGCRSVRLLPIVRDLPYGGTLARSPAGPAVSVIPITLAVPAIAEPLSALALASVSALALASAGLARIVPAAPVKPAVVSATRIIPPWRAPSVSGGSAVAGKRPLTALPLI